MWLIENTQQMLAASSIHESDSKKKKNGSSSNSKDSIDFVKPSLKEEYKSTLDEPSTSHIEYLVPSSSFPDSRSSTELAKIRCQNQSDSSLLRLPRELRDIIIAFSVLDPTPHSPLPPLLQTCHALRPEVAEIYYSKKLILAGGAPSPMYEKGFFRGFDPEHKRLVKRCHWLWDAYGTEQDAMKRARELDGLTGVREGVWTVGFIDVFGGDANVENGDGERKRGAKAVYVNCRGEIREPGSCG